jgi:diguanylate cyclase (GGDEF)-like protein
MRALESKNVQLQEQALHDPLTKLYNRRFFDESLSKEMFGCMRTASPVGVIFGDIDHFKKINDAYGHQFGDLVLQRVADLLLETARNSDIVARYGGEEFVALVTNPTEKGLERFAERIRERIAREPFQFNGDAVSVTISIGAALMIPARSAKDFQKELLAAADACLYESKSKGRNCVTVRSLISAAEQQLLASVSQQKFSRWLTSRKLLDLPALSKVLLNCPPQCVKLGELAVNHQMLTPHQVNEILEAQTALEGRFGEIACQKGWLTEQQLAQLLAWQQENPKQLAAELIRQSVLQPQIVAAGLDDYLREVSPQPALATA